MRGRRCGAAGWGGEPAVRCAAGEASCAALLAALRGPGSCADCPRLSTPAPTNEQEAGNLSILFDVGGVLGGAIAGYLSGAPRRAAGLAQTRRCGAALYCGDR